MIKIKPLGKRVLVQRSKVQTTKGGILLPDTAQEKPKQGKVVAIGPGSLNDLGEVESVSVKIGDTIVFGAYSGTEVKTPASDDEYLILSEDEILGVLD